MKSFRKKLVKWFVGEEIKEMATLMRRQQDLMRRQEEQNSLIFDLYQDYLIASRIDCDFDVTGRLDAINNAPKYLCVDSSHNYLNILLNTPAFSYQENSFSDDAVLISWELARWESNMKAVRQSITQNKEMLFIGDAFLRSIDTFANAKAEEKYRKGISFGIDDLGYFYDAGRPSRMEVMLNTLTVDEEEKKRARKCIDKIVETHLTKYNHQPIYEPNIGRTGVPKILVVDQSYGDMSIKKGLASDNTFAQMLDCAIKENPEADVIVKTHPDTIARGGVRRNVLKNNIVSDRMCGGYYVGLEQNDHIYPMTDAINPISLIKYCDKVYVCTTQLGFEALMCGKEVHVFGMPYYAGWGLTNDRQKCARRIKKRTLEEVFYIAYILYTQYVNPEKMCRCEIEEAMDYLLTLRDEYERLES